MQQKPKELKLGIIGLGYVGLPLVAAFSKKFNIVGFDINQKRVSEILNHYDSTNEVIDLSAALARNVKITNNKDDLSECNFYIITVPTPVDKFLVPNLNPLKAASTIVAENLRCGDTVVFESTVYPGTTEEICIPILSELSGLILNQDFFVGYSPERINPGDKTRSLNSIVKLTSGSSPEAAKIIEEVYSKIINKIYSVSSIKVAEAAKLIENAQRDINIAFVNELAKYFKKLDIDTNEVLDAANTKWNFLDFRPGLVGGHCIGVDPYYLTYQAAKLNFFPEIIAGSRRVNDGMAEYVAADFVKILCTKLKLGNSAKILILGVTFKENCPDIRNTQIVPLYHELKKYGLDVQIFDPLADKHEFHNNYDFSLLDSVSENEFDGILLAVPHNEFAEMGLNKLKSFAKDHNIFYDLKALFRKGTTDGRL